VISTLGGQQIDDQVKLIAAVKEAGNIKVHALVFYSKISISFCEMYTYIGA